MYDGAACMAKYIESLHFDAKNPESHCMKGKRLIELGKIFSQEKY